MKHTLTKLSDTKVKLEVTLGETELLVAKKAALKTLAPQVKVAGFRKGKVPANVAEKNLDPTSLASQVADEAINIAINEVAISEELRILDRPEVDLTDFKPYDSMTFTAEIEILPEITLGDYKKLNVSRKTPEVAEQDVTEVIERMRKGLAEKEEVTRAAKDGDEAVINFVGTKAGEAVDGATGNDYPLQLGSNTFIPGFEEGIIGHKVGDEFDLPLTFPKDYHAEELKGAKVDFHVTLTKLSEVKLPKVDAEFAAKCGPFTTVAEMKKDIKRELLQQREKELSDQLKDDLVGALVEASTVPVPELLIEDQVKSIERDFSQNLMYQGMSIDQYMSMKGYKDHDELHDKEFKVAATRRVQAGLVLAELSKIEKIDVSTADLDARLADMKAQSPAMAAQLDSPDARRDLANRVLTEKTVDRLVELNVK